ncbi:MAG: tRNA-dihydrouridine synthase family protein [Planctomycetaceae bacterium]|nr:tRNA-dihydrouridine synthase family protein [Planctomycetaceae bacterium]
MSGLQIGCLNLKFPAIQAALSGYSDAPMRRISRLCGAEFTLCEVFLDQFVVNVSQGNKARLYLAVDGSDHPTGAQLMGSDPEMFVSASKKLVDSGFDLIDLNFACPVKKVLGRCRGGFLMTAPKKALEIVDRVRGTLSDRIPLTIKLRKGFDDSAGSEDRFFEILDGAFERGIAAATVHGRTVLQRYAGLSDWNFLAKVKRHAGKRLIFGSGDLFTAETVVQRMSETGVDGVALARGVIGNPWLFGQVRAALSGQPVPPMPTLAEQAEMILRHYDLSESLYGAHRSASDMRKFGVYYAKLHPNEIDVRTDFVKAKNRNDWLAILEKWYFGNDTGSIAL